MRLKTWAASLAVALTLPFLHGCGDDNANDGSVRIVNATTDYSSIDLYTQDSDGNDNLVVSGTAAGTVSGYALNATTGVPSSLAGSSSTSATDPGPAAISIENSIGRYIYTANFVGNSVSGLYFDPNAGTTQIVQNSPFPGTTKATAVATVKHGDHAIQVNPSY